MAEPERDTETIRAVLEGRIAVSISDPNPTKSEALEALGRLAARLNEPCWSCGAPPSTEGKS